MFHPPNLPEPISVAGYYAILSAIIASLIALLKKSVELVRQAKRLWKELFMPVPVKQTRERKPQTNRIGRSNPTRPRALRPVTQKGRRRRQTGGDQLG
jgi:hypothetical protein